MANNRIFLAVLMYGPVTPRFYMNYGKYVGQVARVSTQWLECLPPAPAPKNGAVVDAPPRHTFPQDAVDPDAPCPTCGASLVPMRPSVVTSNAPYLEHATTNLVQSALTDPNWDYLVFLEHDNVAPDDWAYVVANELDPEIHKVVGRWYFGKAQEDMRSICGYVRPNGNFDRFSYDEVQYFREHPGLYRVGDGMPGVDDSSVTFTVGVGMTAVHRSVFENWTGKMPWFRSEMEWIPTPDDPLGRKGRIAMLGHDVNFCLEAAKQGYHIWVDTRKAAGHIGEFVSDEITYTATAMFMKQDGRASAAVLAGKPDPESLPPGIPTAMTSDELKAVAGLAKGKTILEIGSRYGASTLAMAGSGAQIVYALDWHRGDVWHGEPDGTGDTLEVFWRYTLKYHLRDKIVPLVGRSDQILPLLPTASFDVVLVDGDHSYEGALYDMAQALRLVKTDGVVAIHDYNREEMFPYPTDSPLEIGVTRAARQVLGEPDEVVETIGIYHLKRPAPLWGLDVLAAS